MNQISLFNRLFITLALVCFVTTVRAADAPYDEVSDAKAEVKRALAEATKDKVPVLLVFGANWCPDCKVLSEAMKSGSIAPLIARDFKVVKINVGRFDKNVDIAQMYDVPLKKGIPAVAIVVPDAATAQGRATYVTKAGELADARSMGDKGIYDFFKRVVADAKPKL
jgi:thioredoxin 1